MNIVPVYNCNVITIVLFTSEIKMLQLRQTPFTYISRCRYILCDILQLNIIIVIFVKDSNHFLFPRCCCKISKCWSCAPDPWLFEPKINSLRQTKCLLFCQVLSHSNQGFSFYHANSVHTHDTQTPTHSQTVSCLQATHIHTHIHHHDKVIAISAPPY